MLHIRRAVAGVLACTTGLLVVSGCSIPGAEAGAKAANAPGAGANQRAAPAARVDIAALQDQVAAQLRDQVGGRWKVTCPPDPVAASGTIFTCAVADRSGLSARVSVTITDATGGFAWQTDGPPTVSTLSAP